MLIYLRIAWRNLIRNRTLSFINIFGLALGITFTILIGMWIWFQYSFDNFNVNKDRISIVGRNMLLNGQKSTTISNALPLYDELKTNYPGIKRVSRVDFGNYYGLSAGNNKSSKLGLYVDPAFLQILTFSTISGNPATALDDPNSIVLTQSLAASLFGSEDAIGRIVKLNNQYNVQVTAVIKDVPKNSSLSFDFLAPFQFRVRNEESTKSSLTRWNNNFVRDLVELKEGVSLQDMNKQLAPLLSTKNTGVKVVTIFLYPMSRWNLWGDFKDWKEIGTKIEYIRLFGIIGIFILLIACINFMNLSTARSERRALEVGIRKTVGSGRGQLIAQFMTESVFTSVLAFFIALLFIQLLLPYLQDLGFDNIHFDFASLPLMGFALAVCLVAGLLAGSYPAFYLSSFAPVKVLKGIIRQGGQAVNLRKVLVVSQFVASIALIISTGIVVLQVNHAKHRSIGYDPNNLITVTATPDLLKNYDGLKQQLLNTGRITAVTRASSNMTYINNDFGNFSWEGEDPHTDKSIKTILADWDYEKTAGLQFIAGRPFSTQFRTDSNAIILNEAAVKLIGYKDPVGKTMKFDGQPLTIIGVTRDVVMEDPFKPVPPGILMLYPSAANAILVRLKTAADLKSSLALLQPIFEKADPGTPWDYHFADEDFDKKFAAENQVAKLAGIFALLAIVISCLGLFGLAAFMAERRSKEISIRKVLGASVTNLWLLLSKEFIVLVGVASLIASPLAIWLMNGWLNNYTYRIQIHWWIPLSADLLAIAIAIATVSTQAVKTAAGNPAKHLKTD